MQDKIIHIRPRYCPRFTDENTENLEANYHQTELDWQIPLANAALVCVDLWNFDIPLDMQKRDDKITRNIIAPLVNVCRQANLLVIHAPSPDITDKYPNCLNFINDDEQQRNPWPNSPDWPPKQFKTKTGPYAQFARPTESKQARNTRRLDELDFHDLVKPINDEPIIDTGEQLHRLCAHRKLLHLFYVGFHTPGCMTKRTYGFPQMIARGYNCTLLRDCTNGMETAETFHYQQCMNAAIASFEYLQLATMTSQLLIDALRSA